MILLENKEGQWLKSFLYDKRKVNTVAELTLTSDAAVAWQFSDKKDAQNYIDESFESKTQQLLFDSQEFKVIEHEFVEDKPKNQAPIYPVLMITQYKKTRHKLYTHIGVIAASGGHKVIYKDVDDNSRPYFVTNDGYSTPHKYLMIDWLNKH